MRAFQDLPISRKLTVVILLASGTALAFVCAMTLAYEVFHSREDVAGKLSLAAQMIGFNSIPALIFDDPNSAVDTLRALRADDRIVAARLYTETGDVFATYFREDHNSPILLSHPREEGNYVEENNLLLFRNIAIDGEVIGTIYLQFDLGQVQERLWSYVGIIGIATLLSG